MTKGTQILSGLRNAAELALPFFRSEERHMARLLLAGVIAMQLATVGIAVLTNYWRNDFFQALQETDWAAFQKQFWVFCLIGVGFILTTVYQQYLMQWLLIRWRRWMTEQYLDRWLDGPRAYHLQVGNNHIDNPDQRVAEDIRLFIELVLQLGTGLLGSVASLFSFVAVLWGLSALIPLKLFGETYSIPGYLVWTALIYAVIGTAITHWIGKKLVDINYEQERREADFRFSLIHVRENAQAITLMKGERAEFKHLNLQFAAIVANFMQLIKRQKLVTFFAAGYRHYSLYFPYLIAAPLYFSGSMKLGTLMQSGSAFNEVRSSFSYFITAYPKIAELVAATQRLEGFQNSLSEQVDVALGYDATQKPVLMIEDLIVKARDNVSAIIKVDHLEIAHGERVFVTGASGIGKTSLARAIGGIWPFWSGKITFSTQNTLILSQRPYLPQGNLKKIITYPLLADDFTDREIVQMLVQFGLPELSACLDVAKDWNAQLSEGQKQRLTLLRAVLQKPDFLLLDEATSAIDQLGEESILQVLDTYLQDSALLIITHRLPAVHFDFHVKELG